MHNAVAFLVDRSAHKLQCLSLCRNIDIAAEHSASQVVQVGVCAHKDSVETVVAHHLSYVVNTHLCFRNR